MFQSICWFLSLVIIWICLLKLLRIINEFKETTWRDMLELSIRISRLEKISDEQKKARKG